MPLRAGITGMRASAVIRLRPCMTSVAPPPRLLPLPATVIGPCCGRYYGCNPLLSNYQICSDPMCVFYCATLEMPTTQPVRFRIRLLAASSVSLVGFEVRTELLRDLRKMRYYIGHVSTAAGVASSWLMSSMTLKQKRTRSTYSSSFVRSAAPLLSFFARWLASMVAICTNAVYSSNLFS